ncbi:unnamed protein product [Urochloa decumbens]|uniref:Uncharacterized protein n=1 Tax=Urochloa decumbens TaxID=240449 RepID=A0ABC9AV97_9POAL
MAGGKSSRRRRAARGVAAAGEGAIAQAGSAKRKAVAEVEAVAGHLAPPLKEYAFDPEGLEEEVVAGAGGYAAATAVAVADDGNAAGEKPPRPQAANRMSMREVQWILNHEPTCEPTNRYVELMRSNPTLIPPQWEEMDEDMRNLYFGAHMFFVLDASFPELQAWVRRELETKGYVEMDDDWIRRRKEAEQILEELRAEIEAICMYDTLDEDDDDDSDYDDDDEFYR